MTHGWPPAAPGNPCVLDWLVYTRLVPHIFTNLQCARAPGASQFPPPLRSYRWLAALLRCAPTFPQGKPPTAVVGLAHQQRTAMARQPELLANFVMEQGQDRIIDANLPQRRMAVLIEALSGRADLALHWVQLQQLKAWKWKAGLAVRVSRETLARWSAALSEDLLLKQALADPFDELRVQAHCFLAESVVAESVRRLAGRGLAVPSRFILHKYVRLLHYLPQSGRMQRHLRALDYGKSYSKKWSRRFRDAWGLQFGGTDKVRRIAFSTAQRRAAIFLRWLRHVFQHRLSSLEPVVLNMDETNMSNIKREKLGVVMQGGPHGTVMQESRMDGAIPRTSLIATVSSVADLQKHLPQIRLVRTRGGQVPSRATMANYAVAGSPQIAWHGGTGWISVPIMLEYLRQVARQCREHLPGRPVVLVMDAHPCHLATPVLRAAWRLGMHVVIIPAKLTWALQPLDVSVFRTLKATTRQLEFDRRQASVGGVISKSERVIAHGDAIRMTLTRRDWSRALRRCALTGDVADGRQDVLSLLAGMDVEARCPSAAELQEVLQVPAARAAELRALLLPALAAAPAASLAEGSAAAGGVQAAAAAAADSQPVPKPFVLRGVVPLPPGRRGGASTSAANLWLPPWAARRPTTRSMTAASRAPASAAASSSG